MSGRGTLFTIGQFAALHRVNKKTLMWYDEIGLFQPEAVGENGYRYYSYSQSPTLGTILTLRENGVSLPQIQGFLANRSAAGLEHLLGEKLKELDEEILRLQRIRRMLAEQKEGAASLNAIDLSEIAVIEKEGQYLGTISVTREMTFEEEADLVVAEAAKHTGSRVYERIYGSMLPAECLYRGEFDGYTALFVELNNPEEKRGLHWRPKGRYLRAYCRGSWDRIPLRYQELLQYAEEKGLVFSGFAYETGINEAVIPSMEEYITQIEIPVTEKG